MATTPAERLLVPRADAQEKATGKAVYTEDLPLPYGTLHTRILRSPFAHARVVSINAEKAKRLPGIHGVVTREHLGGFNPFVDPAAMGEEGEGSPPLIALEKVRYEGEPVAAVAAESQEIAQAALELIDVDYEELPAIFDPRDAMKPDTPLLHERRPGNQVSRFEFGWGNVEQGFGESDHLFEDTYVFNSMSQHPMENVGVGVAEFRGDGLDLLMPIQHPFRARSEVAEMFGLDINKVVIHFPYVGGGFGAKELMIEHLIVIFLAWQSGRPVAFLPSVEESFRTVCRHALVCNMKTGVKSNGTLVAQDIELWFDKGAYGRTGMNVPRRGTSLSWGPYNVPHLRAVGLSYFTNKVPSGSMRALGRVQTTWGYESHYDSIARKLDMDPNEFRLKNYLKRGDRILDSLYPIDSDLDDLQERAVQAISWNGKSTRKGPGSEKPYAGTKPVRGKALSATIRHGYSGTSVSYIEVTVDTRGIFRILHTGMELGMGVYSMMKRVASETLGVPESQIEVAHPDTTLPYSSGIGGSRDTVSMGMATQRASEDLKGQIFEEAAKAMGDKGGKPEEWRLAEGRLWHGEQDYPLGEVLNTLQVNMVLIGKGHYSTPHADNPWQGVVPHWELGVGAAEVEVDPETGEVKLLQYVTVTDVGTAVHPQACKGQLDGGAVMGLGDALYEEMVYGNNQLLNGDPFQYRLPLLEDLPQHFDSVMVENHDGPGPMGSKGISQNSPSPVAPAIANAIYDAIGVRIKDTPITPEKILRGLGKL